jgi:hypothetical protein
MTFVERIELRISLRRPGQSCAKQQFESMISPGFEGASYGGSLVGITPVAAPVRFASPYLVKATR